MDSSTSNTSGIPSQPDSSNTTNGNLEMVDLTPEDNDMAFASIPNPFATPPSNSREEGDSIGARIQQLAVPRQPPQDSMSGIHQRHSGLGQHAEDSLNRKAMLRQNAMSNVMPSIEGGDRGNNGFRNPTAIPGQMHRRPSHRASNATDIEMMDNERGPLRSDYATPATKGRYRQDSAFPSGYEDMSMDETPSKKRPRADRDYDVHGNACSTPAPSSRSHRSSSKHHSSSSSGRHYQQQQPGLMGSHSRSQLSGRAPANFNAIPLERHRSSSHHPGSSRSQAQPVLNPPPAGATTFSQEDLNLLFQHLQVEIKAYQTATANLNHIAQDFKSTRDKVLEEQKSQSDHIESTLANFAKQQKTALRELEEKNEILQAQIDEINARDPTRPPPHGAAYGGPAATTQPRSSGLMAGIVQPSQAPAPTANMRTGSRGGSGRSGTMRSRSARSPS